MKKTQIGHRVWVLFAALTMLVAVPVRAGDDPSFIAFHVGGYDVNDNETAGQLNIEYRSDWD